MEYFKADLSVKCDHLRKFGRAYLGDESWSMRGVGEGAERELLEGFGSVSKVFNRLPKSSQEVIKDITIKMGDGMAEYVSVDMGQGTTSLAAYERYCHMVAGLVGEGLNMCMHAHASCIMHHACTCIMHACVHTCAGEGLSRAFVSGGLESATICGQGLKVWPFCPSARVSSGQTLGLANSMGLYLQKTNIIRDYLEDYADNRAYWPQEVWRKFARCVH